MHQLSRRGFTLSVLGALAARAQTKADVTELTLAEAAARIRSGSVTPTELVQASFERVKIYNPKLNAFITVMRDSALRQAKQLETEQRAGKIRSPLHGIPIAIKDNIDTAGVRTTAASAVFDERVPAADGEVVRRLKNAGAILIGKTNLHEFAFGGSSATSYFGPVRNPWALDRTPGGSSGGSAAAVAADLCFGALGTDTGGSIRTPASYCSVVGLKPTYGLVPIRGIIPLILSLDHCGPITRTVEDAGVLLNAMAGYDRLDFTSVEHAKEDYVAGMKQPVAGMRIGVPRAPFFDLLDDDVARLVDDAIGVLGKMTKSVAEVTLPPTSDITLTAETFAYHQEFFTHQASRYQIPERRMLQDAAKENAADYIRSRWKLEQIRRTIDDAFTNFDLVALPTRRHTPGTVNDALESEQDDSPTNPSPENTTAFDIYGIPAITIPCGFSRAGLPVGLMIAGPRFSESRVLALAAAYERATEWHKRRPVLRPDTPVPPLASTDDQ